MEIEKIIKTSLVCKVNGEIQCSELCLWNRYMWKELRHVMKLCTKKNETLLKLS